MTKSFDTSYGKVEVRNVMIPGQYKDLYEGIEIKTEEDAITEIDGYYDLEKMTVKRLENLMDSSMGF